MIYISKNYDYGCPPREETGEDDFEEENFEFLADGLITPPVVFKENQKGGAVTMTKKIHD